MDYCQNGDGRGVYMHYAVIWPLYGTHECMTYHYMDPSGQPCLAIFLCKKQLGPSQHHLAYKLCMAMGKFLTLAEHWVTFKISKFAYEMYKMLCMIHYWHIWSLYQICGTHILAADDKSLWIGSLLSGNFATQALFMSDRRCYKYRNY